MTKNVDVSRIITIIKRFVILYRAQIQANKWLNLETKMKLNISFSGPELVRK